MTNEPIPYEVPEGTTLTTLGEVRRLDLEWRWLNTTTRWRTNVASHLPSDFIVVAVLKPRPTVEVDAEELMKLWDFRSGGGSGNYPYLFPAVKAAREAIK